MKFFQKNSEDLFATKLGKDPADINKLCELYETIMTKICVFDNRLYDRIPDQKSDPIFKKQLNIEFYKEDKTKALIEYYLDCIVFARFPYCNCIS